MVPKKLKFSLAATLLVCILSQIAHAGNGGSTYSRFGIGDIRFFGGGRASGMGGTTLAFISPRSINRLNPAGQTRISQTHLSGTFFYEGFRTTDGNESAFLSNGNFGGAVFSLPISPDDGLTLTAGFSPYSTVNYKIQLGQPSGGRNSVEDYFGDGGLSTALVDLSLSPVDSMHFGIRMNYLFGQIRAGVNVSFPSSEFSEIRYRRTTDANGFGVTFGMIYNGLGKVFGMDRAGDLSVGAILSTGTNLNATQENINTTSAGEDTLSIREGELHIPVLGGIGISWLLKEKFLFGADLLYQNWNELQSFGVHPPQIRNSTRISIGLEIQPSRGTGLSFWERAAYRIGAYYLASYYQVGSTGINEFAFTAGMGMPISFDTSIDLALEYGRRGTTDQQLLRDNIFRFSITLNAGERWFVRTEEE